MSQDILYGLLSESMMESLFLGSVKVARRSVKAFGVGASPTLGAMRDTVLVN